jgi:hypothetical protein
MDNFRTLTGYGWKGLRKKMPWKQDKGHANEARAFFKAVTEGTEAPILFDEIAEVSEITIKLAGGTEQLNQKV